MGTKDVNYSLNNKDNYKTELDSDVNDISEKLTELIIDYLKFITNTIKLKKNNLLRFIMMRGLDTLINVFNYLLLYTKNLEVTYFHCQKAFYFYSEFVSQISDEEKMFLQLNSRDATTYVYKKTIYEINNEIKKNNEYTSDYTKIKLDTINNYIHLYKTIIIKLINNYGNNIETNNKNINSLYSIFKKINIINNNDFILSLSKLIEIIYCKIEDFNRFHEISNLIIKKTIKKPELFKICIDKSLTDEFDEMLDESPDKFVNWLIN